MHCSACPYTGACALLIDTVQNLWPSQMASLIGVTPLTRVCYRDHSYAVAISCMVHCMHGQIRSANIIAILHGVFKTIYMD